MLAGSRSQRRRTYVREALLLAGFLLVVVLAIVTVVVPDLSKTPDDDRPATLRTSAPAAAAETKASK